MSDDTLPLLPCPFCGHDTPEFERMGSPKQSCIVICGMCGCRHESSDENERNGESWNTRVQACADAAIERCALVCDDYCGAWSDEGFALAAKIRALKGKPQERTA